MINNRFKKLKNNKKKSKLIVCGVLLLLIGIFNVAYSKYGSDYGITINTPTGELIFDATVNNDTTLLENGLRYFTVTVKNHKDGKVTSADIDYKITVTNQEGSNNGKFQYVDDEGNTDNSIVGYQKELIIDNYSFSTTEDETTFKIYTMVDSGLTEDVNYNIVIDAEQKEMSNNG